MSDTTPPGRHSDAPDNGMPAETPGESACASPESIGADPGRSDPSQRPSPSRSHERHPVRPRDDGRICAGRGSTATPGPATERWIDRWSAHLTPRRVAAVVVGTLLGLAIASGSVTRVVEAGVMVGLPAWILYRLARSRLATLRIHQDVTGDSKNQPTNRWVTGLQLLRAATRSLPRFGGGFYGIIATGTFLGYQVAMLGRSEWLDLAVWHGTISRAGADPVGFLQHDVSRLLWDILFPISETWISGLIHAAIWPVYVLKWGGWMGLVVLLVGGALIRRLGPRLRRLALAWMLRSRRTDAASSETTSPPHPQAVPSDPPRDPSASDADAESIGEGNT